MVTALYKSKGDSSDVNNYRGISVLPPLGKIFEKLLSNRLRAFLKIIIYYIMDNMALEQHTRAKLLFMK